MLDFRRNMLVLKAEMINQLVSIIANFRKGELFFDLDDAHVERWLLQFTNECQDIILSETIHIFKHWYFTKQYIEETFLDKVVSFLCKKYKYDSAQTFCREATFVDMQEIGQSQKQLIQMLCRRLNEQYQLKLNVQITEGKRHFVYIDDGLYTGSRARKDLMELIYKISPGSTLDVFYLVAGSNGFTYTMNEITPIAKRHDIALSLYRMKNLENIKTVNQQYVGDIYKESYAASHLCLWPDKKSQKIPSVNN